MTATPTPRHGPSPARYTLAVNRHWRFWTAPNLRPAASLVAGCIALGSCGTAQNNGELIAEVEQVDLSTSTSTTLTTLPSTTTGSTPPTTASVPPESGGETPPDTNPELPTTGAESGSFVENVAANLATAGLSLESTCDLDDPVERRIMTEYGSIFVAADTVQPPPSCVFANQSETEAFQSKTDGAPSYTSNLAGIEIRLQTAAMDDLLAAVEELRGLGLSISPRGTDSARRDYEMTERIWLSRVEPGLNHWVAANRLSADEAERIRGLETVDQISEILALEADGMFFSTNLSKTILASVAAPGTSQHISMLALDVSQHDSSRVREVLALHGWFQTVATDAPHFTYLGVPESELPDLGLRAVDTGGRTYWVPDI